MRRAARPATATGEKAVAAAATVRAPAGPTTEARCALPAELHDALSQHDAFLSVQLVCADGTPVVPGQRVPLFRTLQVSVLLPLGHRRPNNAQSQPQLARRTPILRARR